MSDEPKTAPCPTVGAMREAKASALERWAQEADKLGNWQTFEGLDPRRFHERLSVAQVAAHAPPETGWQTGGGCVKFSGAVMLSKVSGNQITTSKPLGVSLTGGTLVFDATKAQPTPTGVLVAALKEEIATLRAHLSAAQEALAAARAVQDGSQVKAAPVRPAERHRPVAPLERVLGACPAEMVHPVVAAIARGGRR